MAGAASCDAHASEDAVNLDDAAGHVAPVLMNTARVAAARIASDPDDVAEVFEKEHKNVLRDIDAILTGSDLSPSWFRPSDSGCDPE